VQPVGTDRHVSVDVRIVAATHRDLSSMVEQKTFRFDLLHRLSVLSAHLPALRERLEDLPCLISAFYEGRSSDPGEIAGENLERLRTHPWPGNVRELRNVLERAWVLSGPSRHRFKELSLWLEASDLATGEVVDISLPFKEAKERWVDSFERRYLAAVFAKFGQNITRASEHAEINRRHFRELLEQHGLREPNGSE
jgi:two-component system, NtrC family, nitrogen regulation response regulator GlnG